MTSERISSALGRIDGFPLWPSSLAQRNFLILKAFLEDFDSGGLDHWLVGPWADRYHELELLLQRRGFAEEVSTLRRIDAALGGIEARQTARQAQMSDLSSELLSDIEGAIASSRDSLSEELEGLALDVLLEPSAPRPEMPFVCENFIVQQRGGVQAIVKASIFPLDRIVDGDGVVWWRTALEMCGVLEFRYIGDTSALGALCVAIGVIYAELLEMSRDGCLIAQEPGRWLDNRSLKRLSELSYLQLHGGG